MSAAPVAPAAAATASSGIGGRGATRADSSRATRVQEAPGPSDWSSSVGVPPAHAAGSPPASVPRVDTAPVISQVDGPGGGVSIRFRTDSLQSAAASGGGGGGGHDGGGRRAAGGGSGRDGRDVQSRFDHLRSLLSDTREQLHESSLALSPALGVPDVDDTDLDTTRGPGGGSGGGAAYVAGDDRAGGHMQMSSRVSFGGFDASSIMMGTVRDSTQPCQPSVELDFLAFLGIARLMLTVRAWLCAACAPCADVDVKQSDTVSLLGERCGRSHATECCRPHDQVRASSATRCHAYVWTGSYERAALLLLLPLPTHVLAR